MKICLIINPKAGPSTFKKQLKKAEDYLLNLGCEVKRLETTGPGDAIRLAQQAAEEKFDTAVAIGGDGTVNEVCNGLVGTDTALGVLPAGTANVFAAEMGIPIWNPLNPDAVVKAASIIATGQRRKIADHQGPVPQCEGPTQGSTARQAARGQAPHRQAQS